MKTLAEILRRYWGYDDFRPLQLDAMRAVTESSDSLVVLATGGGKSLCFQAPAILLPGLAVVVSPLISLMKDQVDALTACGVPAAFLNSSTTLEQRRRVVADIRAGRLKLLYLSPERLMTEQMLSFLRQIKVSFLAIDEAHCISDWGHDFRPEYRSLGALRTEFPGLSIHAYTATATQRVRDDIVRQLGLIDPRVIVGSFHRPNLEYRVARRIDLLAQIEEVVSRRADLSGIIYCMRRRDVEAVCAALRQAGRSAIPYHAGMTDDERRRNQEQFSTDQAKIIVATVAFGMGIDKPDVRYVIHAAAPKSLEHYQQESGRAGRDGLEAECHLFYSPADFVAWRRLLGKSDSENGEAVRALLTGIEQFCTALECRHRALVSYFGEHLDAARCGACDVCLDEFELHANPLVVAQKILSCVARLREGFGAAYVGRVLVGSREGRILEQAHDRLSTYGILSEYRRGDVRVWIDQLIAQRFLAVGGDYCVLKLTPSGRQVLRGEVTPHLTAPGRRPSQTAKVSMDSWEGVDREMFEVLRAWRRRTAAAREIAPFMVFSDLTLRDLARCRPSTAERLRQIAGIGEKKSAEYGTDILRLIAEHCRRSGLELDVAKLAGSPAVLVPGAPIGGKSQAFPLFAKGQNVEQVAATIGRARSTVSNYLAEYLEHERVVDPSPWVDEETLEQVRRAAQSVGWDRMKPIFETLQGAVSYESIRIAVACLRNRASIEPQLAEPA